MTSPKAVKLTVSRFTLTSGFCFAILVAMLSSIAVADVTYTDSTIPTSNVTTGSSGVGNVTFEISGTSAYNNSILGDGNAYKTGSGTLTLNGSVSNTVSTYVNGGNLTLNCSYGWLATYKTLNVNSAQLNLARTDIFGGDNDIKSYWHLNVTNGTFYANYGTYNNLSQVILQNSTMVDGGGYQGDNVHRAFRLGTALQVSGTGPSYIKSENLNSHSGVHLYNTTSFYVYDSNQDVNVEGGADLIVSSSLYNRVNKASSLILTTDTGKTAGTMVLSADNYYTGNTTCNAGELIISGSIQSRIYADGGTITFNAPGKTSTMSADGYGSAAHVGFNATGTLNVKDGTVNVQLSNHSGSINLGIGSGNGTINVSGGKLHVDGRILMAANGGTSAKATINVSGDGLLELGVSGSYSCTDKDDPGCGVLWFGNGVTTINLNGGTLAYYAMKSSGPAAGTTFNFNGGTVKAVATNNTNYMPVIDNLTYNVKEGGAKFDTNGYNVTVSANLQHDSTLGTTLDGGLTKSGDGTLTLTGTNTYTGPTKVTAGTLALNTENTIAKSSSVENNANITVSAAQTINNLSGTDKNAMITNTQALCLYNTEDTVYAGSITGTINGHIFKRGDSKFTMSGAWTNSSPSDNCWLEVDAGEIAFSDGTLSNIRVNVWCGSTLTFDHDGKTSTVVADGWGTRWNIGGVATADKQPATVNINAGTVNLVSFNNNSKASISLGCGGNIANSNGILNIDGGDLYVPGRVLFANGAVTAQGTLNMKSGSLTIGVEGAYDSGNDPGCGLLWFDKGISTVNLDGGTLAYYAIKINDDFLPAAGSTFNFNGGTIKAVATNNTDFMFNKGGLQYYVKEGGAKFDTNGYDVTVSANLQHDSTLGTTLDGGLTKSGDGTLTLTAENTYTGATKVTAGNLSLTTTNAIKTSSSVENNATITTSAYEWFNNVSGTGTFDVKNNNMLVFNNNDATTFSGKTTGNAAFVKIGDETLTVTGELTHTGTTLAQTGTLILSGSASMNNSQLLVEDSGIIIFDSTGTSNLVSDGYATSTQIGSITSANPAPVMTVKNGTVNVKSSDASNYSGSLNLATAVGANGGAGILNVQGGLLHIDGRLLVSSNRVDAHGTLNLDGGKLDLGVDGHYSTEAHQGTIVIGAGVSTLNLNGGELDLYGIVHYVGAATGSATYFNGTQIVAKADNDAFIPATNQGNMQYIVKEGGAKIDTDGHNITISANITGSEKDGGLTKSGEGTLTLSAKNTFNGNIVISEGVLVATTSVPSSSDLNSSLGNLNVEGRTITVESGATLRLGNINILGENWNTDIKTQVIADGGTVEGVANTFNTFNNLALKNGGQLVDNGGLGDWKTYQLSGTVEVSADDKLSADKVSKISMTEGAVNSGVRLVSTIFDVDDVTQDESSDLIVSDFFLDSKAGESSFTKTGKGTMELQAANTYSQGTTISAGTLKLTGNGTLGTGSVTINENGTLEYNVADTVTKNIANSISGLGTILKSGAGILVMAQDATAKQFDVDAGTLQMADDKTFTGSMTIGTDGKLEIGIDTTPVTATITNNLTVDTDGKLNFDFSTDKNDVLKLDGQFNFNDSTITLSFNDNNESEWFDGLTGDGYQLISMSGNSLTGDLSRYLDTTGLTQDWGLTGLPTGLYLTAAPTQTGVPEPSTWALLILGFAGLMWFRRRSKQVERV